MLGCGLDRQALDLPDTGQICCYGVAVYGPERCTCWTAVYDLEQQACEPGLLPPPPIPVKMCDDCAYRPNSPERRGEDGYQGSAEDLDGMVTSGDLFVCHKGIRKPVKWVHPSGAEIPGHPAAYDPPIIDGIPYKADGTPATICAGWLLRRTKEVYRQEALAPSPHPGHEQSERQAAEGAVQHETKPA